MNLRHGESHGSDRRVAEIMSFKSTLERINARCRSYVKRYCIPDRWRSAAKRPRAKVSSRARTEEELLIRGACCVTSGLLLMKDGSKVLRRGSRQSFVGYGSHLEVDSSFYCGLEASEVAETECESDNGGCFEVQIRASVFWMRCSLTSVVSGDAPKTPPV